MRGSEHHGDHDHHGHNHDHSNDHSHDHHGHSHGHHGHNHAPDHFGRAFAIGMSLNLAFVIGEAFYGVIGHSLALLADAGHNISDVLGLGAAWLAAWLGNKAPSARYTYGFRRSSILAALGNATLLLLVTGAIAWEAVLRLFNPGQPEAGVIMVVAAVGIIINGGTALMFMSGRKSDLNLRAAFVHMASDALVQFGTVMAGVVILLTGWNRVDPLVSLVISVVIVMGTWSILRDAINLSLDAVPQNIDPALVQAHLRGLPGVVAVHDLHIWALSTTDSALTAHLVQQGDAGALTLPPDIAAGIKARFGISHVTIQMETESMAGDCALMPENVI